MEKFLKQLNFLPSPLKHLAEVNELVQLEQKVLRDSLVKECKSGQLKLCDGMGVSFTNVRTFCQLYGANVSFTDMTNIVRQRVAQFPCRFNFLHLWNALQILGIDAKTASVVIDSADNTPLLDIYRTALTSEIMDSKQSEYYSDYAIYGVDIVQPEDMAHNRQPDPGLFIIILCRWQQSFSTVTNCVN